MTAASEQRFSFVSHLECSCCGAQFSDLQLHGVCGQCGKGLLVRYDLQAAASALEKRGFRFKGDSMWRYAALLPVRSPEHVVSLGEGATPTLHLRKIGQRLGLPRLFVKEEAGNATASFKARGMSAAVSKAVELGVKAVAAPTAGNAGAALAAYAAASAGSMQAHVFMPRDTPQPIVRETGIYGAQLTFVDGSIADAARKMHEAGGDWFDVSTLKEPYRLEGKKTLGFELAEFFNWTLPDVIVYPTGGGTGLIGMWKAFEEMEQLGWVSSARPRMVAVQAAGCAPVVAAHRAGLSNASFWQDAQTYASGLRVPKPFADYIILDILKQSGGTAIAVQDADIERTVRDVARTEGLYMCPEGAATVFALQELMQSGLVQKEHTVVVFNTASGLKY